MQEIYSKAHSRHSERFSRTETGDTIQMPFIYLMKYFKMGALN